MIPADPVDAPVSMGVAAVQPQPPDDPPDSVIRILRLLPKTRIDLL